MIGEKKPSLKEKVEEIQKTLGGEFANSLKVRIKLRKVAADVLGIYGDEELGTDIAILCREIKEKVPAQRSLLEQDTLPYTHKIMEKLTEVLSKDYIEHVETIQVPQTVSILPQVTSVSVEPTELEPQQQLEKILSQYKLSKDMFISEPARFSYKVEDFSEEVRKMYSNEELASFIRHARTKNMDPREYAAFTTAYITDRVTGKELERGDSLPVKLKPEELHAVGGDSWYFEGKPHSPGGPDHDINFFRKAWKEQGFLE